jgi:enoyl-[acyl-carrier protein] reductase I
MYSIDLSGRHALVMGVANHRSLSWAIARCLHQAGAKLCLTYAGDRLKSMSKSSPSRRRARWCSSAT